MASILRTAALLALYYALLQGPAEGHPLHKQCHISKYKRIQPGVMSAARMLQNLQQKRPSCRLGLRLRDLKHCDVRGQERLMLTLHRISLVVLVLEDMEKTELVTQNLEAFSILHKDLMNCEKPKSPELRDCVHQLRRYRETESGECVQSDVLLSLVWTLTEDVGYLTHGGPRAGDTEKTDLLLTSKLPPAKRHKGKKKKSKKAKKMKD